MNQSLKVLVADDEAADRELCARALGRAGYTVVSVKDGSAAVAQLEREQVDLAMVDWQMPALSGVDLLRLLRIRWPSTGVVVMTAFSSEGRAVASVELADGYLRKPFSREELTTMVARALEARRRLVSDLPTEEEQRGAVTLNRARCEACFGQGPCMPLTVTEYKLINHLLGKAGQLVEHRDLAEIIVERKVSTRHEAAAICKHHISGLRHKLEPNPQRPAHLQTVWGRGYKLVV